MAQVVEANANYNYSWEMYCPAIVRIGPEPCSGSELSQNQCPFVRGFKLTVNERMAALRGRAKVTVWQHSSTRFIPFNDGAKWSSPGKGSGNTSLGGGQQRTHSSMGSAEGGDIFEEEVSSDEEVRLELVPGTTQVILANNITDSTLMHILQVYHPLNPINKYLLATVRSHRPIHTIPLTSVQMSDARAAVTHESDWRALIGMVSQETPG